LARVARTLNANSWPEVTRAALGTHGSNNSGWTASFPLSGLSPTDYSQYFVYVPAKATDNPHLDAAYWQMLDTLPDYLRAAFRDGSWDIFIGQAFPEISRETHAIQPVWPVPEHAPLCT
jgi:hypothetical protein